MKSRSRQGREENGEHKREVRRSLDLAKHDGFCYIPETVSILDASKNRPAHYLYIYLGYKIELRFNEQWTAQCPHFGIEISFTHRDPKMIKSVLAIWLLTHIRIVVAPLPAILTLARKHNCTLEEAQVIFDERASR